MTTGSYISGVGHLALILWVLFGGLFASSRLPPPPEAADVSLISAEEFAALSAPQSSPQAVVDIAPPVVPEVEASPVPPVRPDAAPDPVEQPVAAVPPEPDPVPQIPDAPAPEPAEVSDDVAVLVAPALDFQTPDLNQPSETPQPRPAPRVAALPVPEAPQTPEIADTPSPRISPNAETNQRAEEEPPAAPEEATTEIVTEAETPSATAPSVSPRPRTRPTRPVQQAETPAPAPEASDAIADAVAAAVADTPDTPAAPGQPSVPSGPPLTGGEKDALRVAVQRCWNVGSLSSDALSTTVVVAVTMARDGKPDTGSIRMLSSSGGSADAARQAFEAARRAIIRCGAPGFDLPTEKYGQWRDIEITFNPESMRIK